MSEREPNPTELGEALRRERIGRNVSLRRFASLLNTTHPYLSAIETGKKMAPAWIVEAYEANLGLPTGHFPRPQRSLETREPVRRGPKRRDPQLWKEDTEWTLYVGPDGNAFQIAIRKRVTALQQVDCIHMFTIWPDVQAAVIARSGGAVLVDRENRNAVQLWMVLQAPLDPGMMHECGLILSLEDTGLRGWQSMELPIAKLVKLRYRIYFEDIPARWTVYRINGGRGSFRYVTSLPTIPVNPAGFCETVFVKFREAMLYGVMWGLAAGSDDSDGIVHGH